VKIQTVFLKGSTIWLLVSILETCISGRSGHFREPVDFSTQRVLGFPRQFSPFRGRSSLGSVL